MAKFDDIIKKDKELNLLDISFKELLEYLNGKTVKEAFKNKYDDKTIEDVQKELETFKQKNK